MVTEVQKSEIKVSDSTPLISERSTGDIDVKKKPIEPRLVSIDALRGFDMFFIKGGQEFLIALFALIYTPIAELLNIQFGHVAWDGFHFEDLIFPLFVFLSGVSIPFSVSKRLERGEKTKALYIHIIKRSLLLYLLGFIYNNGVNLDYMNFRYLGVLHRIAICYFVASVIVIQLHGKKDVLRKELIIFTIILLMYWAFMKLIPVPGYGTGILTPEGNLSGFLDRLLLPGSFCCYGYGDSEGILSTIPAVSSALFGVISGQLLRSQTKINSNLRKLAVGGFSFILLGLTWNIVFPINKTLWSSSFVLFAGGWSLLLLVCFYWIIDVRGFKKWSFFFQVIGSNSIFIYMTGGLLSFGFLADFINLGIFEELFLFSLEMGCKWLILYIMYRKKWFLKV